MKQILTARECARLNKRLRERRSNGLYLVQQKLHPCEDLERPQLPMVYLEESSGSYIDECGRWVILQPKNRNSAKIVRRYLLETLPNWPESPPDFDGFAATSDPPDFDGFVASAPNGQWTEITQATGPFNWTRS